MSRSAAQKMSGAEKLAARYPLAKQMVEEGTASPQLRAAVELLLEGKVAREIGEAMGLATSTAHSLLSDPNGVRARERKDRNHGICADCGTKTFSSGSRKSPLRCKNCSPRHRRAQSRERILQAIQRWNERYGYQPTAWDWNIHMARDKAHPERLAQIEAAHREFDWPAASTVQAVFGSWNAAIEAAGFASLKPAERLRPNVHKEHLQTRRKHMLSPKEVIQREIEKNKERKATLAEQIAQIEQNVKQLEQAQAVLSQ